MEHAWRIIVQLDSNAVSLLNHVAVGNAVALGVNHNSGTQRALTNRTANRTTTTGAAEEPVKEIIERILVVRTVRRPTRSSAETQLRSCDSGFGIDADHARLQLV